MPIENPVNLLPGSGPVDIVGEVPSQTMVPSRYMPDGRRNASQMPFERKMPSAYKSLHNQEGGERYNKTRNDKFQFSREGEKTIHHKINILGTAISWLTGMPSKEDLDHLKRVNEYPAGEISKVAKTQSKVIATVNTLGHRQAQIAAKVNNIAARVDAKVRQITCLQSHMNYLYFETQIQELKSYALQYQLLQQEMLHVRAACESNLHSEVTVPTAVLREILMQSNAPLPEEIRTFYQYLTTHAVFRYEGRIMCAVLVPIPCQDEYRMYHISVFPVCGKDGCITVFWDVDLVLGLHTEELYYAEKYFGQTPQICPAGVIHEDTTEPCLHGTCIITQTKEQLGMCPVTISR